RHCDKRALLRWRLQQLHRAEEKLRAASPRHLARLQQFRYQACPAGLMRRTDTAPGVAIEIFVEQEVFAEMGIGGKLGILSKDGPGPVVAAGEDPRQPARQFVGHLVEGDEVV